MADGLARIAPVLLATALGTAYAVLAPRTGDLPAHVFRAELFGREGFTVWNGRWYSGHHTPAYSLLFPPLAWALGPWVAGGVSLVAGTALFEPLARRRFGARAGLVAALLFALGLGATVFAGRLTFALGVAAGVGAVLALERRRGVIAAVLAAASAIASPVAGVFLGLVGVVAAGTAAREDRRAALRGVAFALAALMPPAALALAFPEGGNQPFVTSSMLPAVGLTALFAALLPRPERGLRVGAVVYSVAVLASFAVATPMGGNAVRLGQLAGAALAAGAVLAHPVGRLRGLAVAALVLALLAWSVTPAVRDLANAVGEPSTEAAYFAPLVAFLERAAEPADRVEVAMTREHWEAAEVARRLPIARGWLRSTDIAANPLFYRDGLDSAEYERWLRERAVRFVALADAPLDYSARAEAALVAGGPPYLRLRWRGEHWRVYEVVAADRPADAVELRALEPNGALVRARRPGRALLPVRYTPYFTTAGGCVEAQGDWTLVTLPRPGPARVSTSLSAGLSGRRGAGCATRAGR